MQATNVFIDIDALFNKADQIKTYKIKHSWITVPMCQGVGFSLKQLLKVSVGTNFRMSNIHTSSG